MNDVELIQRKKKKRRKIFLVLFVFLLLALGYAYLQTTLNITGTTNIAHNTWHIYWDKNTLVGKTSAGVIVSEPPSVSADGTSISFNLTLQKPGDFAEFTIDAKNDGSLDAMIEEITKTINGSTTIPSYISYTATYADGSPILQKQLLKPDIPESYKVRIEFNRDIENNVLPSVDITLNCSINVKYVQSDSTAIEAHNYVSSKVYNVGSISVPIGQAVPNGVNTLNSPQAAMSAFGYPFFLKHILHDGNVSASYVGFEHNGTIYYLQGGDNGAGYANNLQLFNFLQNEFSCTASAGENPGFVCYSDDLKIEFHSNGLVSVDDRTDDYYCDIQASSATFCGN